MNIQGIGFDYGGVLEGSSASKFNTGICNILGITVEEFHEAYFKINHLMNKGILQKNDFYVRLLEDLGKKEKLLEVIDFLKSLSEHRINKDVFNLSMRLRKNGYKVGVLSNHTSEMAKKLRREKFTDNFDAFIVSSEIGKMKPEPDAFRVFFKELGVKPSECIFIDDTEKNFIPAKDMGFHPILFTNYANLLKNLHELKIKI